MRDKSASSIVPFSDEKQRVVLNLQQLYESWLEVERGLRSLPYGMKWKTISGRDYLYEVADRQGNGKSLGPRSEATESSYVVYIDKRDGLRGQQAGLKDRLSEVCRQYRALGLPMVPSEGAEILREADRRGLMPSHLVIVGTNAMPAYAIEAGGLIVDGLHETQDFDMAWTGIAPSGLTPVQDMLKAVDPTYTVNDERRFQMRNVKGYEVELLCAPSRLPTRPGRDRPLPTGLPEQEWLLNGKFVQRVVVGRDATPARLVVPDPRWFGLQKLWLADKPERDPLKKPKDRRQGLAVLNVVHEAMPHYDLGEAFSAQLPDELRSHYETWRAQAPKTDKMNW